MSDIEINGFRLVETCRAHPEQYDVYLGDRQVGYLRLRHGYFTADVPDAGGETVFETEDVIGGGRFEDNERVVNLTTAVNAIALKLNSDSN